MLPTQAGRGAVIWEGPSEIDGNPIAVIATGLDGDSTNEATGPCVQTWIIRADMAPLDAVHADADESICGGCRHRGQRKGKRRTCYVNLVWAVNGVYKTYDADEYPREKPAAVRELADGHPAGALVIRAGSYGDPFAVPVEVWEELTGGRRERLGYTHMWREAPRLRPWCMASVDTPEEAKEAWALGWRTYRIRLPEEVLYPNEFICPKSAEATRARLERAWARRGDKRTLPVVPPITCNRCLLCDGLRDYPGGRADARKNPVIMAHGTTAATLVSQRRWATRQLALFGQSS